jgi:hypothetical protein
VLSSDEPATFDEAESNPCWRRDMEEEISSIEENKTWTLYELSQGRQTIGLKWVFKVKRDEHGSVVRHKARLVVKSYAQRMGIDYDEVSAPVARLDTMRILIALAAHKGREMHHLDVKSVFLNGELQEEVFVHHSDGFIKVGSEHKVFKLKKALYGLHQASRAWYAKLDITLIELGFSKIPSKPAIYKRFRESQLIVGVYVDDLIVTGAVYDNINEFKKEMALVFKMSDLGLLQYYLGIEVRQSGDSITLSQGAYAKKILEKPDLMNCIPRLTPMESHLKLSRKSSEPLVDATLFHSIVGSLHYLVNTRPDLAFVVRFVSWFLSEPHEDHMVAVKHILRYNAGTMNWGVRLKKGRGDAVLTGFSDNDYVGDVDSWKSTTGVFFFLSNNPITW